MWIEEMVALSSYAESTYQQTTNLAPDGQSSDRGSSLSSLRESEPGESSSNHDNKGSEALSTPKPSTSDRPVTRTVLCPYPSPESRGEDRNAVSKLTTAVLALALYLVAPTWL